MAMVDASLVLNAIVAVSIAAGAFFAVAELRDMKKDRRIQLIQQVNDHIGTMEFMNALGKIFRSNTTDAKELEKQVSNTELSMVASYFEGVAHLAAQDIVHKEELAAYFPFYILWKKMGPWIVADRIALDLPPLYSDMEKLAQWQEGKKDLLVSGFVRKSP
jgi:ATP-dependent Clp protease adapter protein ClpS